MAKTLMFQGTSSHVGKSILTTAFCRIFYQDGYKTVPFKAQNMALNSYVTKSGGEMGRAQVAQAEAAGLEPDVMMNPVLLKPTGDARSQVVVMGQPVGTMSAKDYHGGYRSQVLPVITQCLEKLDAEFDVVVIEGAGSPAEVNLKANDVVNMRIAELANAPVLLIADIDRGGALASIVGTLELLEPHERDRVKGLIINKFRGDIDLLRPALDFLHEKTGKPVVGVIPHIDYLGIDEEDSVTLEEPSQSNTNELEIAVLKIPKISNYTDFSALAAEPDTCVRYVGKGEKIGKPDLIILPGSKNTIEDLLYLREEGFEAEIKALVAQGVPLVGICGGYQMLGLTLNDPYHTESDLGSMQGMGFLSTVTTFAREKLTHQVKVQCHDLKFLEIDYSEENLDGYEIHMGLTEKRGNEQAAFEIVSRSNEKVNSWDGLVSSDGLVLGTYIHGIFDNDQFRRAVLNQLRVKKGLSPLAFTYCVQTEKQKSYNKLAQTVREHVDMELIHHIMGMA